jgi:1-aminocyclopropane-1-carboxylate deaminase
MLLKIPDIEISDLTNELFINKQIDVSVVRLDKIHSIISGNKLFKLYYFLERAIQSSDTATILTFGGAYSNHLAATAYACKISGLKSIGIVRGEKPPQKSHTLQFCMDNEMQLKFISRDDYAKKDTVGFREKLIHEFGECIIVPEGGYHPLGAKGAALIMDSLKEKQFTHICCATGTATTIAGLLLNTESHQQVISIPVLKGMTDIKERILFLTENKVNLQQLKILNDHHFGGYAKSTPELFAFMNQVYQQYQLPTDFVYTGKMLFGIFYSIKKDYFPAGSKIACLHTGGLQGNFSLPVNTLLF